MGGLELGSQGLWGSGFQGLLHVAGGGLGSCEVLRGSLGWSSGLRSVPGRSLEVTWTFLGPGASWEVLGHPWSSLEGSWKLYFFFA